MVAHTIIAQREQVRSGWIRSTAGRTHGAFPCAAKMDGGITTARIQRMWESAAPHAQQVAAGLDRIPCGLSGELCGKLARGGAELRHIP